MRTLNSESTALLVIDFQSRLMRVIDGADSVIANAKRLLDAAALLGVPALFTEQNPNGLGATIDALAAPADATIAKMSFDACAASGFMARLDGRQDILVTGCEAHVCVLQTVLALIDAGRRVFVARDAIGSRRPETRKPLSAAWSGTARRSSPPKWRFSNGLAPPRIRASARPRRW